MHGPRCGYKHYRGVDRNFNQRFETFLRDANYPFLSPLKSKYVQFMLNFLKSSGLENPSANQWVPPNPSNSRQICLCIGSHLLNLLAFLSRLKHKLQLRTVVFCEKTLGILKNQKHQKQFRKKQRPISKFRSNFAFKIARATY